MSSLDIRNLSKTEIKILRAVCLNVIYVLSFHVNKVLICVSSIPCKITSYILLKMLNEREIKGNASEIKGNEHIWFVWRLGGEGSNTRQELAESTNPNLQPNTLFLTCGTTTSFRRNYIRIALPSQHSLLTTRTDWSPESNFENILL